MSKTNNSRIDSLDVQDMEALLREELGKVEKDYVLIHQLLERLEEKSEAQLDVSQEEVDEAMLALQEAKHTIADRPQFRLWWKPLTAIAVVLCVVLMAIPVVSGAPFVQELVAKWNDKLFWIESPGTPVEPPEDYIFQTDNPGLQQLYDAVTELGITAPVVPMWLPEGSELAQIQFIENGTQSTLYACFNVGDTKMTYHIIPYNSELEIYKESEMPKSWNVMGVQHYYATNEDFTQAIWAADGYIIRIAGNIEECDLHEIVYSLYYGGIK